MPFDPAVGKPEIDFPESGPPADLVVEDLWEGDGPSAGPGQVVSAHYVGVAHSTGEEFDSSWDRGAPLDFPRRGRARHRRLGPGPARHEGRRSPQADDPGAPRLRGSGRGQRHQAGECLIFVVDLVDVR